MFLSQENSNDRTEYVTPNGTKYSVGPALNGLGQTIDYKGDPTTNKVAPRILIHDSKLKGFVTNSHSVDEIQRDVFNHYNSTPSSQIYGKKTFAKTNRPDPNIMEADISSSD